jgi:hypothetical protein
VALYELATVLLAFGGMTAFFAWTPRREPLRVDAAAQQLPDDSADLEVLVVDLDGALASNAADSESARILRVA